MSHSRTLAFLHRAGRWFNVNLGKAALERMSEVRMRRGPRID